MRNRIRIGKEPRRNFNERKVVSRFLPFNNELTSQQFSAARLDQFPVLFSLPRPAPRPPLASPPSHAARRPTATPASNQHQHLQSAPHARQVVSASSCDPSRWVLCKIWTELPRSDLESRIQPGYDNLLVLSVALALALALARFPSSDFLFLWSESMSILPDLMVSPKSRRHQDRLLSLKHTHNLPGASFPQIRPLNSIGPSDRCVVMHGC